MAYDYEDSKAKMDAPDLGPKEMRENAVWDARLQEGLKHVAAHREAGNEMMRTFLDADATFQREDGSFVDGANDMVRMNLPFLKNLLDAMLPKILANDPSFYHKPKLPQDEIVEGRAALMDVLIKAALHECDFLDQVQMAGKEGLIWPYSAVEVLFDPETGLPAIQWHAIDKITHDPRCNGLMRSMQWVAVDIEIPIEEARRRYGDWLEADASSLCREKSAEYKSKEDKFIERYERQPTISEQGERVLDLKRLKRIWVRGDFAGTFDTDDGFAQADSPERPAGCMSGKNEVLIWDPVTKRVIHREPWPFVLDLGRLPIFFFVPESFPGRLATIGTFEPFVDLQNKLNWLYSFIAGGIKNGAASIFLYDKETFADENVQRQLASPRNLQGIGVDMSRLRSVEDAIKFVPIKGVSDTATNGLQFVLNAFDRASQSSDLRADGVAKIEKATTASIAQSRVENRLAQIAKRMKRFVTELIKAMSQVARSVMDQKDVAKWVPPALMGTQRILRSPDGSTRADITTFWLELDIRRSEDVEIIRGEMDVEVHPGSLVERDNSALLQDELAAFQTIMAAATDVNAGLNRSGRELAPEYFVGAIDHLATRLEDLMDGISTDPYRPKPEHIRPIPQTVGEGEQQTSPVDAQQLIENRLRSIQEAG